LRVRYGGGTENYVLRQPSPRPDVVFCAELAPADAGTPTEVPDAALPTPGAPIEALLCELWTQGAATLTVEASGYPATQRDLRARRDDCGIETVEDEIRLSAPDAGS
jgi:hypothetical protein